VKLKSSTSSILSIVLTTIVVMLAVTSVAGAAGRGEPSWPRWRGPNGDGVSTETDWDPEALDGEPKVLWTENVGMGYADVVFSGDRLFTVGLAADSSLLCLDAETGQELWACPFSTLAECQATPCTDGRHVYALNKSGELLCVSVKKGELLWRRDISKDFAAEIPTYGYAQSPVLAGDYLILNVNTSGIALNKETGELVWASSPHTAKLREGYYASPVVYEREDSWCILLFSGTGLFSVYVQTGHTLWFHEWIAWLTDNDSNQANIADPIIFEDEVFIGSYNGLGASALLDVSVGEPAIIWQNENLRNDISSSVLVDGYLYGIDGNTGDPNGLRCLEWRSGEVMWEKKVRTATITAAGDKLIVLEENGVLHILEATPSAYTEISSCKMPVEPGIHRWWSPPVLYRGRLYCRDWAGELVCLDMRIGE
jgi:outer membrane protein assembly factor BamB